MNQLESAMIRFAVVSTVLTGLVGCASTANWQHPAKGGDGYDGATGALADCESYAQGRGPAPAPSARMEVPEPTSYRARGTYRDYGSYGTYNGTITPKRDFASGFASGYNAGSDLADAIATVRLRSRVKELTEACMRTQGWIETSTPEGQGKFKEAAALQSAEKAEAKEKAARDAAEARFNATYDAFVDAVAARPGGINYRKDRPKQDALHQYMHELLDDPMNNEQMLSWFLIEAHKKVLRDSGAAQ